MNIFNRLAEQFSKVKPLPEGVHHMQAEMEDQQPYRLHLRLRGDGSGVLIVNASTILHLNPTAAEYAFHFIKGTATDQAAREISRRYRISKGKALEDYTHFVDRIPVPRQGHVELRGQAGEIDVDLDVVDAVREHIVMQQRHTVDILDRRGDTAGFLG